MGECLLYSKFFHGEYLLYSKVSGGKVYYVANIPKGKVYYTTPALVQQELLTVVGDLSSLPGIGLASCFSFLSFLCSVFVICICVGFFFLP